MIAEQAHQARRAAVALAIQTLEGEVAGLEPGVVVRADGAGVIQRLVQRPDGAGWMVTLWISPEDP